MEYSGFLTMKNLTLLALSVILGAISVPTAFAGDFASDADYNAALSNQAFGAPPAPMAPALQSMGATGQYGHTTDTTWQDALNVPAFNNENAKLGQTFQGNMADRFINNPIFNGLNAEQGLMAVQGKHNRPACYQWGSGGFYGAGSKSAGMKYKGLPPTSTTPCDIHVAE